MHKLLFNHSTHSLRVGTLLWPLAIELRPCSQGHVTTQLMQMFLVVNYSSCFSTSMMTLAIRDDSNAITQWIRCNGRPVTPYTSYDFIIYNIIMGNESAYFNSFWQNKVRDVCEVLLYLFCHATSTDVQHDLPESAIRSGHLARPQVRLLNKPFRVKMHANFSVSLDASKTIVLSILPNFLIQTLFAQSWWFHSGVGTIF